MRHAPRPPVLMRRFVSHWEDSAEATREATRALIVCDESRATTHSLDADTRIVGGCATSEFPAVGVIRWRGRVSCTGTYIGNRRVVTAAHCVQGVRPEALEFGVGPNGREPDRRYRVEAFDCHQQYRREQNHANDVAVLILESEPNVTPIALATPDQAQHILEQRAELAFVGYGYWVNRSGYRYNLGVKARVSMPVIRHDPLSFRYGVPASDDSVGRNTCEGDSGGPAIHLHEDGMVIVGVTSYGDGPCAEYGVNARVDPHLACLQGVDGSAGE